MKKSLYLALFLAVVGSLSALLITAMFDYASPILATREKELIEDSMRLMFRDRDDSKSIIDTFTLDDDRTIQDILLAYEGNEVVGVVFKTNTKGRNADITMLIGIDANDEAIKDVVYLAQAETKGIGDRITGEDYVANIVGQTTTATEVDLIAGATVSSTAVKLMVEEVSTFYQEEKVGEINE